LIDLLLVATAVVAVRDALVGVGLILDENGSFIFDKGALIRYVLVCSQMQLMIIFNM